MFSCGSSKEDMNKLQNQIDSLKQENADLKDDLIGCQTDPDVFLTCAKDALAKNDREAVESLCGKLLKYHPNAKECLEAKKLLEQIDANAAAEVKRKAKEEENKKEQAKEEQKRRAKAVSKLKKKYDDVSGITWYKNPYFTHYTNSNHTSVYIGKEGSSVWMNLLMSYEGENWIFFERAFLSYDGNTYEVQFNEYENKKTENSGGDVWEWVTVEVDEPLLVFLKKMVKGKTLKMRLTGKYSHTRNLTSTERKALEDVLLAYDVLKNGE